MTPTDRQSIIDQIKAQEYSGSMRALNVNSEFRTLCAHATRLEDRVLAAEAAHAEAQARNRVLREVISTALDSLGDITPGTPASREAIAQMYASLIAALDFGSSARTVSG